MRPGLLRFVLDGDIYMLIRTTLIILLGLLLASVCLAGSDPADLPTGRSYIHPSSTNTVAKAPSAMLSPSAFTTFHNGETLVCSYCHTMHASAQHPIDDAAGSDPWGGFPQSFAPTSRLLKASDPVALCLTCHDNMVNIPDVVGTDVNALDDRSAGHFASVGTDNPRGHRLDYGLKTDDWELCMRCHFGGTFQTASVTCIDCHNPHGNQRARNLQWASYPGGEPQFGLFVNPGATGMAKYEASNVSYGTLNSDLLREASNMCTDCHHVFSGAGYTNPDGSGVHSLHPTYDSERNARNFIGQGEADGSTDPGHWTDGVGAGFQSTARLRFVQDGGGDYLSCTQVDPATNGVFCLSCHKAHGGYRAYGLNWSPPVVSGINGEGCDQCHDKANETSE